jgi:Leucine-rich repeat (LRR) protein
MFNYTTSLLILHLGNNAITSVSPSALAPLVDLRVLVLRGNQLKQVPSDLAPVLEQLDLEDNFITLISAYHFEQQHHLVSLNLQSNDIFVIEENAFTGLRDVQWIGLSSNNITSVPIGAFSGVRSVAHLELTANPLQCNPFVASTHPLPQKLVIQSLYVFTWEEACSWCFCFCFCCFMHFSSSCSR